MPTLLLFVCAVHHRLLFRQSVHWRIWGSKPLTWTLNSRLLAWVRSLVLNRRETNISLVLMFQQQCHLTRFPNIFYPLSRFPLKQRDGSSSNTVEITVYDYYVKRWGIQLKDSVNFPCLNVGKPKRPTYLPIEVSQRLKEKSALFLSFHHCSAKIFLFLSFAHHIFFLWLSAMQSSVAAKVHKGSDGATTVLARPEFPAEP